MVCALTLTLHLTLLAAGYASPRAYYYSTGGDGLGYSAHRVFFLRLFWSGGRVGCDQGREGALRTQPEDLEIAVNTAKEQAV